jgi:hypothetical protein
MLIAPLALGGTRQVVEPQRRLPTRPRAQSPGLGADLQELDLNWKNWCPGAGSNHRHADFQSAALPTELPGPSGNLGRRGLSCNSPRPWPPLRPLAYRKSLRPCRGGGPSKPSNPSRPPLRRCPGAAPPPRVISSSAAGTRRARSLAPSHGVIGNAERPCARVRAHYVGGTIGRSHRSVPSGAIGSTATRSARDGQE